MLSIPREDARRGANVDNALVILALTDSLRARGGRLRIVHTAAASDSSVHIWQTEAVRVGG